MSWVLIAAAKSLIAEFNQVAPGRDKTSDGTIGDAAHAGESSDHNPDETGNTPYEDADDINEVHAVDIDKDLNRSGITMEQCVQVIVRRHRAGVDIRLQNVIYNRRIWSRTWGWTERPYAGTNPHDKHAHYSFRYTTAQENDTRPWGLQEELVPTQAEVRDIVRDELAAAIPGIAAAIWAYRVDVDVTADGVNMQPAGSVLRYTSSEHHRAEDKIEAVAASVELVLDRITIERLPAPAPPTS